VDVFVDAFVNTFQAVLKIFTVALAAGLLIRAKWISQDQIKAISAITIRVLLPCMIFANIVQRFEPGAFRIWPVVPLVGLASILLGLGLGALVFAHELSRKRSMLALTSIGNASFLVLPIGWALFPAQFEEFKLYCFLYLISVSPALWSLGKYLTSTEPGTRVRVREFITPPFVANIVAVILVFLGVARFLPAPIVGSMEMIGSATVPMAMLVLGAVLGAMSFDLRPHLFDAFRVGAVRMILVPLVSIVLLRLSGLAETHPLLAVFFVIESASAPATSIVIQVKHYGGDEAKIGSVILLTYLFCVLSMPFWVALWQTVGA